SAQAFDPSAEDQESAVDGVAALDPRIACGRLCPTVHDTTREAGREPEWQPWHGVITRYLLQHALWKQFRQTENRGSKTNRRPAVRRPYGHCDFQPKCFSAVAADVR